MTDRAPPTWAAVFDALDALERLHATASPDPASLADARRFAATYCAVWEPPASVCGNGRGQVVFSWPHKTITV